MRRWFALALCGVLLPLAGCRHRAPKTVAVPPPPPEVAPVMVSVPPPTHPTEPLPEATSAVPVVSEPPPPAPKKPHRKRVAPVVAPPVQTAAAPAPAIDLGTLSAGGDVGSGARSETEQLVSAQKARLDKLPAGVVAAHGGDVEQARRFVKGADDAWKAGDVEGAHTLALKAKVLLDDLSK